MKEREVKRRSPGRREWLSLLPKKAKPPARGADGFKPSACRTAPAWSTKPAVLARQFVADVLELLQKSIADRAYHADYHDRDAGGDQAIFDGGRAGFILQKRLEKLAHTSLLAYLTVDSTTLDALPGKGSPFGLETTLSDLCYPNPNVDWQFRSLFI